MEINEETHAGCIARIMTRGSIGKEEARAMIEAVSEAAEKQRISGVEEPIVTAAWQMSRDLKANAERAKLDTAYNTSIRLAQKAKALENAGIVVSQKGQEVQRGGKVDLIKALNEIKSTLGWREDTVNEQSVEGLWHGLSRQTNGVMLAKLQKAGLIEYARDPGSRQAISDVWWKLNEGTMQPDLDNASAAVKTASIFYETQQAGLARLNSVHAHIGAASDYVTRTMHDLELLIRGGRDGAPAATIDEAFQRWWKTIEPALAEKTFADVVPEAGKTVAEARETFGRSVFNSLVSGEHEITGGDEGPRFEGGGYNIAKKLSQQRTIYFKDGNGWSDYAGQYGKYRNLLEQMVVTNDLQSRRYAFMHEWGTNPQDSIRRVLKDMAVENKADPTEVARFKSKQRPGLIREDLWDLVHQLDGTTDMPKDRDALRFMRTMQSARAVTNMALLGQVGLTHAASLLVTVPSNAAMHGEGMLSAIGRAIRSQFESLKDEDRIDYLAQSGAYGDGLMRHITDHFGHGRTLPGTIAQIQDHFMTATGINHVFDHVGAGMKEMAQNDYARAFDKDFAALKMQQQNRLRGYGIRPEDWGLLRTGQLFKDDVTGRNYLLPNIADTINRDGIEQLLRGRGVITDRTSAENVERAIAGYRTDISNKLVNMYEDTARLSRITPGIRERAMLSSPQADTWKAEMLRSAFMYHSWALAAVHQVLLRQIYQNNTGVMASNLAKMVVLSVAAGYIRSTIRDLAAGKQQQEPRTVGEAARMGAYWLSQGGMLGVLGDWVFGEAMRPYTVTGNGFGLGGPIGSMAGHVVDLATKWEQSLGTNKKVDVWDELGKPVLQQMIPFSNLLYTKALYNYFVYFPMMEMMHKGWWDRSNRMMKKEEGRTYYGFGSGYHP